MSRLIPNPQRCVHSGLCRFSKSEDEDCFGTDYEIPCTSYLAEEDSQHPATDEQSILDVLDIELDEVKSRIESSAMGQPLSERSRGEIIGLLHAREKIKYLRKHGTDEQSIRQDEREKVLGELTGIIDGAISQLFTGTEDVVSAHARHKALAWVNMKIKELRENEEP